MTPYDFVSEKAYNSIMEAVKTRTEFNHDITVGKVQVNFNSGKASCGFCNGKVLEGDYIILFYFSSRNDGYTGFGGPLSVDEFITCAENYTAFIRYIDRSVKRLGVDKYEPLEATTVSRWGKGGSVVSFYMNVSKNLENI